jgi:hypothetical protein
MTDKNVEQIKYETELLKLMALFILAVGGSALGLLLGERTTVRLVLMSLGIIVSLALIVGVWRQHTVIRKLIVESRSPRHDDV